MSWVRGRTPVVTDATGATSPHVERGVVDHILILDGTLSSLEPGYETNAGLLFKLLAERGPNVQRRLYYEPGVQWVDWAQIVDVAEGRGINMQIRRAYGFLASQYRPGDRIFLLGYSRGAYAARSLAGAIDRVGLLRAEFATERNVKLAYRHYQLNPTSPVTKAFSESYCHKSVEIEMVGVWDTVKALGMRLPLLWMLTEQEHAFHDATLGRSIRNGFHALALNETRVVFNPVLWHTEPQTQSKVEQVWFRGAHADIGGQLGNFQVARPLSNIPLVWMLEKLASCGIDLPPAWRERYPCDPDAPMVGTWRGFGAVFLYRRRRKVGRDPSERIHPTALDQRARWGRQPEIVAEPVREEIRLTPPE
ncbi:DUF2235 domain-containing protein [Pseudorhodobacter sp.]|uniref:DUF2235 domain-containing protein n=1 Tax=Pseudorhodobacter sp. TaxID=1934400 RepID=UPI0026473607|nr:DUF2235 domain-containing protein [Pseudorhodobacter sp.]MDN5787978.1 DUF2235 domain-containing protein [Pseudorhodobacter sp.]